jgi:hypothetical protein
VLQSGYIFKEPFPAAENNKKGRLPGGEAASGIQLPENVF